MANKLIDIEEVVKIYAWDTYQRTATKKLKLEDVSMKVNWDKVTFDASQPEYSQPWHLEHPSTNVIFESTFNNTTDKEQEHSLKAERTTTVMSTTSVTKGYTTGGNVGLSLAVPGDVLKVTGSFGRQLKLDKASGNTNEKSLTWSTDDTIKVKPKSRLTAKVEIKEDEFRSNFKIDVKIRGRVGVVLTSLRDNNSFLQFVDAGIVEVLRNNQETKAALSRVNTNEAIWTIEGVCGFKYGVSQSINLSERPV